MKNLSRLVLLSLVLISAVYVDLDAKEKSWWDKLVSSFEVTVEMPKERNLKAEWQDLQDQFLKANRALVACGAKACAIEKNRMLDEQKRLGYPMVPLVTVYSDCLKRSCSSLHTTAKDKEIAFDGKWRQYIGFVEAGTIYDAVIGLGLYKRIQKPSGVEFKVIE